MSECRCGHPQHTHVRYVHSCGLCDCLTFRSIHDDQCEAEFIGEAGAWTDCGCADRRAKSTPQRIRLSRAKGWRKPENTVVVARPSKWGNPWMILTPGGRRLAVSRFEEMFTTDEETRAAFGYPKLEEIRAELAGKNLACWCPLDDQPCHADVLLRIANPRPPDG